MICPFCFDKSISDPYSEYFCQECGYKKLEEVMRGKEDNCDNAEDNHCDCGDEHCH